LRRPRLKALAYLDATVTARAKAKYRGLSTAQQTVRLSVASVEMTWVWVGGEEDGGTVEGRWGWKES
jgi:hypothetical protein